MRRARKIDEKAMEMVTGTLWAIMLFISCPAADSPHSPFMNESMNPEYRSRNGLFSPCASLYAAISSSAASSGRTYAELSPSAISRKEKTRKETERKVSIMIRKYLAALFNTA